MGQSIISARGAVYLIANAQEQYLADFFGSRYLAAIKSPQLPKSRRKSL